jgi:uncharacterized protein YecE (DUF72 family)
MQDNQLQQTILIGTSGWTYNHWKNIFYPPDLPQRKWFSYYAGKFNTVEINYSFYRIPTPKTIEHWNTQSPADFHFAIKMNRQITHFKKLKNCKRETDLFFSVFQPLFSKIGIVLIQLPPTLGFDPERLLNFFNDLPKDHKFAFEFRNSSWYREETYSLLRDHKHIFCIHDMTNLKTEKIITADTVYIRFHGFDSMYGGNYPDSCLQSWADWIKKRYQDNKSIFCFFNNDIGGFAVKNGLMLKKMIRDS